jgi:uncharacterized protein YecT (DUF1311 family)
MNRNYLAEVTLVKCAALLISLLIPVGQIHAQTQATMNAQARAEFEKADAELNKTYEALLTKLRDAESKQKLKEKQRAWVASRDAEAARAAKEAEGGSMAPTIRYETITHLTLERIKELKAMLDQATESGPKPVATGTPASPASTPVSVQHKPQAVAAESPSNVREPSHAEKIRDTSSDKKFAVRVRYDSEKNRQLLEQEKSGTIFSDAIEAVELVSLPAKEVITRLLGERASGFPYESIKVVWSPDSKWFALYYEDVRTGYTSIYHEQGGKFEVINDPDELRVNVEGAHTEYVSPVRWSKPGTLVLQQQNGFRDGRHVQLEFTAAIDCKSGKFTVISKKKLPTKE